MNSGPTRRANSFVNKIGGIYPISPSIKKPTFALSSSPTAAIEAANLCGTSESTSAPPLHPGKLIPAFCRSVRLVGSGAGSARQEGVISMKIFAVATALTLASLAPSASFAQNAYITNSGANTVSVIATATNTVVGLPIPVGSAPFGVAVTPDGSKVYVATGYLYCEPNNSTVSVIDTATNTVTAEIPGLFGTAWRQSHLEIRCLGNCCGLECAPLVGAAGSTLGGEASATPSVPTYSKGNHIGEFPLLSH